MRARNVLRGNGQVRPTAASRSPSLPVPRFHHVLASSRPRLVCCSRMRSRRVPVLRLGSRGPGGDARSLRLCSPSVRKRPQASASVRKRSQAFASVRKRSQAFASVRKRSQAFTSVRECRRVSRIVRSRKSSRNAELS